MYVSRALSMYRRNPVEVLAAAERGAQSCLMVTRGEVEDEAEGTGRLNGGVAKGFFRRLPLPPNAVLRILHGEEEHPCIFLPVLDHPLSSNRYYIIDADSLYPGFGIRCSTEDDICYCCGSRTIEDARPRPFDYRDEYQQYEICSDSDTGFYAKPILPDSFPPSYLRYNFHLSVKTSMVYQLDDAQGLNDSLRNDLPELNSSPIIIGKWYTPFVFVKGDAPLKVQVKKSLFYTITLEKHWQEIYSWENDGSNGTVIAVDVSIPREVNFLFGVEALKESGTANDGFIWFRANDHTTTREVNRVGLSLAVVERMRWLEESVGWVDGVERIERVETASRNEWTKFSCFVLVESFVLRRMDGTLVLRCDFRLTHEIQTKWE